MNKSRKRKKRDFGLYLVISIALLPFVLIALAMIYYLLNSFVKTTNAKSAFDKDLPEIISAMEDYKQLNGKYPGDFRLLKNGLTYTSSDICDGSANEPVGCAPDGYNYGISTNYDKGINDASPAADCGYIIVMSQNAIKGLRIIDGYAKLENTNDINCLDFADRAKDYSSL